MFLTPGKNIQDLSSYLFLFWLLNHSKLPYAGRSFITEFKKEKKAQEV